MSIQLDISKMPSATFTCGPSQGHPVIRQTPVYKTLFERSHRAKDISTDGLYKEAVDNLRQLLSLPPDYTGIIFTCSTIFWICLPYSGMISFSLFVL